MCEVLASYGLRRRARRTTRCSMPAATLCRALVAVRAFCPSGARWSSSPLSLERPPLIYAAALASELVKPGQSDLIMLDHVRVAVMGETNGDQGPRTELEPGRLADERALSQRGTSEGVPDGVRLVRSTASAQGFGHALAALCGFLKADRRRLRGAL